MEYNLNKLSSFSNIYLYITEVCQLNCKHCYLGKRLNRKLILSKNAAIEKLEFAKKIGGKKICFLGGEPILHPNIVELVSKAKQIGFETIIIDSNGLDSSLKIFDKFVPSDFSYIQISLDGASQNTHDMLRGKGTFQQTIKTIQRLVKRGFDVRIIYTVNIINIGEVPDMIKFANNLNINLLKFHIFSAIGNGNDISNFIVKPIDWIVFSKQLLALKGKYNFSIQYQPAYADNELGILYQKHGYTGCIGRKRDRLSIFPDDKAYICSYLFDTDLNYIQDNKIKKNYNEFNLFSTSYKSCSQCNLKNICHGSCPAESIISTSEICYDNLFSICRLWKMEI